MRSNAIDLAPLGITCVVVNPGWGDSGKFFNYDGTEYPW